MLNGWFDAFRDNGGPTIYSVSNRTPAIQDIRSIVIYISFVTLLVAFLIVFPGIRKAKFTTFVSVTISLFVGAVILISNYGSDWHVAEATVSSLHKAFSREKIDSELHVHIGLNSVNITLQAREVKDGYREALVKGLPFPILTIAEYFSQELEGFCWGRRYRMAGYYSYILLWTAFGLWLLMNVLVCTVPRYGAFCMQLTGAVMLLTNAVYALLLPRKPLVIPFEEGTLMFTYGWCFWLVLAAGSIAFFTGATVAIIDIVFPNKFSTILEVDYDAPYRYLVEQNNSSTIVQKRSDHQTNGTILQGDLDAPGSSKEGIDNVAYENDDSDGSTIINGKRAISLHHFGKYAEREATKRRSVSAISRNLNNYSDRHGGTSEYGNTDLEAAAMW
ncbi:dual oxidase maturation factor 2-like isoform X2 [Tachypleus tridentatus]|uniref:dual oxidase maturation factor 2-like isoform X2 n=1 Tax=Tachypleus tridentatus TaxID=6853 RepID=UPI003FD6BE14